MYRPKTGDRVRVVLEGKVGVTVEQDGFDIGGSDGNYITHGAEHVVSIELLAPAEPPVGSIVRDGAGDAAQRGINAWFYAVEGAIGEHTWEDVSGWGHVQTLYTPDSA